MWPSLDLRPAAHSTHGSWLGMYGNMHVIGLYFRQKPGCSCRCFLMSPVQHIETLLLYAKNNDSSRYFTDLCLFCPLDASPFDLSRQAFSVCDPKSGQKFAASTSVKMTLTKPCNAGNIYTVTVLIIWAETFLVYLELRHSSSCCSKVCFQCLQ